MDKKQYINKLKLRDKRLVQNIGAFAQENGVRAFLVGGVVRDLVLERAIKDIDIVAEGDAGLLAEKWARLNAAKCTRHHQFRTANVCLKNGQTIDFISTRQETYKRPGALPQVRAGDIYDDLSRRDITINALAILITPVGFGRFYDEFNGLADLKGKRVRVLHANTFIDDPTRIFRVYRYANRLGFKVERWTADLMRAAIKKGVLKTITINRYIQELRLVCQEPRSAKMLRVLQKRNVLRRIDPRSEISLRVLNSVDTQFEKNRKYFKDEDKSQFLLLALFENVDVFKHNIPLERKLQDCLKQSHMIPVIIRKMRNAKRASQIFLILTELSDMMCRYVFLRTRSIDVQKKICCYFDKIRNVETLLTGHDIKDLGLSDVKKVSAIKKELLLAKIDGKVKTKNDEVQLTKRMIAKDKE